MSQFQDNLRTDGRIEGADPILLYRTLLAEVPTSQTIADIILDANVVSLKKKNQKN